MSNGYGGTGLTEEEKKRYGDPDAKWWEVSDTGTEQLAAGFQGGVSGASTGASIGSAIGAIGGPVGSGIGAAIGAGAGFLVGAIAGHLGYDEDGKQAEIIAMRERQRTNADAARIAAVAESTRRKSAGPKSVLPPAPPPNNDMSVLAGSMPLVANSSAPTAPYRMSIRNKFGWN